MEQLWTSLLALGLIASVAGAGAFAQFQDQEASDGNHIVAGILDWELDPDDEVLFEKKTLAPGESTAGDSAKGYDSVSLTVDADSIDHDHVEIRLELANFQDGDVESGGDSTVDGFANQLDVEKLRYLNSEQTSLLPCVDDADGDGNKSVAEVVDYMDARGAFDRDDHDDFAGSCGDALEQLKSGAISQVRANFTLAEDASNEYQGDQVDLVLRLGLLQQADQDVLATT